MYGVHTGGTYGVCVCVCVCVCVTDLLELLYPAAHSVHLNALLAVLSMQLRDGLFLLGTVMLHLLQ